MYRLIGLCCWLLIIPGCGKETSPVGAPRPGKQVSKVEAKQRQDATNNAKKTAQEIADAMLKGDYAQVIDRTYEKIITQMGGREAAIKLAQEALLPAKEEGITLKSVSIGEPGEILKQGNYSFILFGTWMEMTFSGGKLVGKSYLLGISDDIHP